MTLLKIEVKTVTGKYHPEDMIKIWAPALRSNGDMVVSTAPEIVKLVQGKAQVELLPGPARIQIMCGGTLDNAVRKVTIPDAAEASLRAVLEEGFDWEPEIVTLVMRYRNEAVAAADRAETVADKFGSLEGVDTLVQGAEAAAASATGSAAAAAASATAANNSQVSAASSASAAATSEANADESEDVALDASAAAIAAAWSFDGFAPAQVSDAAVRAEDAAVRAEDAAVRAEAMGGTGDEAVTAAEDAQEAATAANGSAVSAASSATDAAQSAVNAANSEVAAGEHKGAAEAASDAAALSATDAATSAGEADASAGVASDAADRAEAGAAAAEADATQTGLDRTAVAADRAHVESQVTLIDTMFTESVPPYLQPDALEHRGPISSHTYGTQGSQPIRDAIIKALTEFPSSGNKNRAVYIPAGDYEIEPGFFSNWDWNAIGLNDHVRSGLRIVGDGKHATRLILQTGGEESWFYDSDTGSRVLFMDLTFEGISFVADDHSKGNGFKQWSSGQDKRFRFIDCEMELNTVLHTLGTGNADLNRFINTLITAHGPMVILDNPQSVANGFDGCDIMLYNSLVEVRAGGTFWINNGNVEMHTYGGDLSDHYMFDVPNSVTNSQGSAEFNATDVRFEVHGANKKLVRTVDAIGMLQFNFTRASFGAVSGGVREVVNVGAGTRVSFRDCIISPDFSFAARTSKNNNPMGAVVAFDSCDIGRREPLWTRCTVEGDQARIMAAGCFRQSSATSTLLKEPEDFDFGWQTAPTRAPQPVPKLVSIKKTAQAIPFPGDEVSNLRVNLPQGAYITRVFVKKEALAGTSGAYQLHVGSADMSTTLASSEVGSYPQEVVLSATDLGFVSAGELAVWATGDPNHRTPGTRDSVAFVEYL